MKIQNVRLGFLVPVLVSLLITGVSAILYHQLSASISTEVMMCPVGFTKAEDTLVCGGSISADTTHIQFTGIPLAIGSNITITQLVNVTNTDSSEWGVQISVTENFGTELSLVCLYLVSPSGREILVVLINDIGIVATENVLVRIPQGESWALRLEGHYDPGTPVMQTNTMLLTIQVVH